MEAKTGPAPGWYRDPSQRHEHRWWNGSAWTPHVMTLGLRSLDYGRDAPADETTDTPAAATVATDDHVEPVPTRVPVPVRWPVPVSGTVLFGALLLAVGAVLPWAEASSDSASFSSSGIDGNGGAALVAAFALGVLCMLTGRPKWAAGLIMGIAVAAGAIVLHDARDISDRADQLLQRLPTASAGVGIGVWLALAGAAIALIGGVMALAAARRRRA